ncbi:hypothetical protein [Crateriforma conspicua]|uniref:hypothetical protein n=1 Tax=Crateriforma conspicua TaxID=2527996 RepID=UPI00118B412B|nr:hypothetical protein [Crateriforma conspicua]QDV62592.1 hypothetical protein Mal65_17260 [Crateriforma conspicua]
MDTKEIRTLCLKRVYGVALTEGERDLVAVYVQTADGRDYLRECQEMKDLLKDVADVNIKPADHEAMVENFERTIRQKFNETVFQPWWRANSAPIILGIMAGLFIVLDDGWSVINTVLLGICAFWLITDCFQRYYYAKVLSRPDLYEYAKASRRRSDRILQSLPRRTLLTMFSGLAIAAVSYGAYWGYRQFGFIAPAIVIFVLIDAIAVVAIVVFQYRKLKRSDPEVWDWWAEEIKE